MTPLEIEAIERATIGAVTPREVVDVGQWIVALEPGTIRRAASAAPLRHELSLPASDLDAIEAAFAGRDMAPAFRLADDPRLGQVRAALRDRGYRCEQPTLVKVADAVTVARCAPLLCEILERPDAEWAAVFTGEGFDPVDAAGRVAALSRAPDAAFGVVVEGGRALAVGVAACSHGWAGIHGMRTAKARRGEGLAGRVLAGLASAALGRGVKRLFLQVEEANAPARTLYRRAGFSTAWRYLYWSRG